MKTENARLSDWVWEQQDMTPGEKLVCLAMLRFRNNRTGLCYPSQASIQSATGLSRSGVQKAIKALRQRGVLEVEDKPGTSNRYALPAHSVSTPCSLSEHEPNSNQGNLNLSDCEDALDRGVTKSQLDGDPEWTQ